MRLTNRKVPKTIHITPEQNEALDKLSKVTKVPQSEFIRQGIELILKHYGKVLKGQKSLIAS